MGNGSSAVFTGNTFNGNPNDIYTGGAVSIQNEGNYRFEGGIVADSLDVTGGASVVFGPDAVNRKQSANATAGALLNGTVSDSSIGFEGTQSFGNLTLTGGELQIGTSATGGALTLESLTQTGGAQLEFNVFSPTDYDTLKLKTAADLTDAALVFAFDADSLTDWSRYDFITSDVGITGLDLANVDFQGLAGNYEVLLTPTGLSVMYSSVPEPAAWILLLLGGLMAAIRRKRIL